jgi:hypothetical protein
MKVRRNSNQRPQRRHAPSNRNNGAQQRRPNGSGDAHRNYERYLALAREAALQGDAIEAENCYQHAEHYFRVMRERTA